MAVRLSALRTRRTLLPRNIIIFMFLVLITLTIRGVLLSTLPHAILHPSHHLLNVLLQIANKLGFSKNNFLLEAE
jgi:hypothetical protein